MSEPGIFTITKTDYWSDQIDPTTTQITWIKLVKTKILEEWCMKNYPNGDITAWIEVPWFNTHAGYIVMHEKTYVHWILCSE